MVDYGEETFDWKALPVVRQKPLDADKADNYDNNVFQGHGAHMPLLVFVQWKGKLRSPAAWQEREP